MAKKFMEGNMAMAEAALAAGCRFFAGFPITPQTPMIEHISARMPEVGGTFLQAESEVVSANILIGASFGGARCMTATSGPGFSLMAEGISFMVQQEVPAVIIDVARSGPGMGGIDACMQDYCYATKGLGAGGGRAYVISPSTVQEAVQVVYDAFDIADKYRTPVVVLTDKIVAACTEGVEMLPMRDLNTLPDKSDWILSARKSMAYKDCHNTTFSCFPKTAEEKYSEVQERLNREIVDKYTLWKQNELRYEEYMLEDAEVVLFAYGSVARIVKEAASILRQEGIKAGVFRPITVFPFPTEQIAALDYEKMKLALDVEMSLPGMMIDDVRCAVNGKIDVHFYGKGGGGLVIPEDVVAQVHHLLGKE